MEGEKIDIKAVYKQYEGESLQRLQAGTSGKSAVVRQTVIDLFAALKVDKILQAAAYKVCEKKITADGKTKLDRTMFTGIIKRSFKTEKDDNKRIWILKP